MYDEQTREVVEPEDRILGFEYSKGEYVLIDPEEREARRSRAPSARH
jgi:non-homologous end joining protein Ku